MTPDRPRFSLVFSRALGRVVVHIHGALDSNSAQELKARLVDVIHGQGNRQLVLDLRETTLVDSAGRSVLVDALRRMQRSGGELVLSGPTSDVAQSFHDAGLDTVFVITPAWDHPAHGGDHARENQPVRWGRSG